MPNVTQLLGSRVRYLNASLIGVKDLTLSHFVTVTTGERVPEMWWRTKCYGGGEGSIVTLTRVIAQVSTAEASLGLGLKRNGGEQWQGME